MKPQNKFVSGAISATIWNNTTKDNSTFNTISLERSYKDGEGNWQNTNVLRVSDLPKAALVLNKAYESLSLKQEV